MPGPTSLDPESERVRAIYDRRGLAMCGADGGALVRDARRWLAGEARGDTLEIGIGAGRTIPHYPDDVRLTGIELSTVLLAEAARRARSLGREVILVPGTALALDFPDATFDTVAFCLVLCTVVDDRRAILEAARVLRPGGRLVAVEHVRSPNALVRLAERLWEPIAIRQTGDHLLRDPVDHLEAAGLVVESLWRGRLGFIERLVAVRVASAPDRPA